MCILLAIIRDTLILIQLYQENIMGATLSPYLSNVPAFPFHSTSLLPSSLLLCFLLWVLFIMRSPCARYVPPYSAVIKKPFNTLRAEVTPEGV